MFQGRPCFTRKKKKKSALLWLISRHTLSYLYCGLTHLRLNQCERKCEYKWTRVYNTLLVVWFFNVFCVKHQYTGFWFAVSLKKSLVLNAKWRSNYYHFEVFGLTWPQTRDTLPIEPASLYITKYSNIYFDTNGVFIGIPAATHCQMLLENLQNRHCVVLIIFLKQVTDKVCCFLL